jgi:hypothetical protein
MSAVRIGGPDKASRTAVALDDREARLGTVRVPASDRQAEQLLAWATRWPKRTGRSKETPNHHSRRCSARRYAAAWIGWPGGIGHRVRGVELRRAAIDRTR